MPSSIKPATESVSTTASPSSFSSCGITAIASDCSIICSSASSTSSCSKTCYSTTTGCSVVGTTITSSATRSTGACGVVLPYSNYATGGTAATFSWDTGAPITLSGFSTVSPDVTSSPLDETGSFGPTGLSDMKITTIARNALLTENQPRHGSRTISSILISPSSTPPSSIKSPLSSAPPATTGALAASWDSTNCTPV